MKIGIRRPPFVFFLLFALVALLGSLAALQHHWLGQVSQGERERMQANLRVAASHFSEDLDRELTRAYISFQLDAATPRDQVQDYYSRAWSQWTASAAHPGLVKSLYLAEQLQTPGAPLLRLDAESNRFEPVEWPAELQKVREQLAGESRLMASPVVRIVRPPIDEEIPALIVPLMHVLPPAEVDEADSRSINLPMPLGCAIVVLDLGYLERELIPKLASRYFAGSNGLDYNLAVVTRNEPRRIIYQSDPAMTGQTPASSDATADLMSLRHDELNRMMVGAVMGKRQPAGQSIRAKRVMFSVFNHARPDGSRAEQPGMAAGAWQLLLKHRAGSLEAVVASARRRNLINSSGILALLTLSMSMILISTQRARRLAKQQMEFVAGVSHELRTPLSVICSAGENLADGVIDDRDQIKRYGAVIRNEGRRLTEMVEQVLEFAGIQSGRRSYSLHAVDVAAVIDRTIAATEPVIADEGFWIEKRIPAYLPVVMADASALGRSIQNLISNAMKYSGDSRWIGVEARTEVTGGDFEVQISVEDRGLGIDPGDLPHIFEPFYRGREAVAAQVHGSGLGLSLVKRIVEAHGGRVSVESAPATGSRFTLHLPAAAQGDPARHMPERVLGAASEA